MSTVPKSYGLLAEFEDVNGLLAAIRGARHQGYRHMDAYTPFPVEEVIEELAVPRTSLPWLVFAGGLAGCVGGFLLQYWTAAIAYPVNIGGRPLNSWPMFIPVTFELTILAAVFTTVIAMLGMNGLPRPHHPLFNVDRFALVSRDRFFLCIESSDPQYDREATRRFLESLHPHEVSEVPE